MNLSVTVTCQEQAGLMAALIDGQAGERLALGADLPDGARAGRPRDDGGRPDRARSNPAGVRAVRQDRLFSDLLDWLAEAKRRLALADAVCDGGLRLRRIAGQWAAIDHEGTQVGIETVIEAPISEGGRLADAVLVDEDAAE